MELLDNIIQSLEKEIKEESQNIKQIILTFLSAYTEDPQNTRVLAPSGEGKTYLVTKVAQLFPKEDVIILSKATSESLKYNLSKKVIENGRDNFQDYDTAIKPIEEELSKSKDKERQEELKEQLKELRSSTVDLIDLTNKTLVFTDSQSYGVWENLKTTLSHDSKIQRSISVNKSKSGTLKGQEFVWMGSPACIYCSAKDEQKQDETNEINTRFNTISLNTSKRKYRKMLDHEATRSSIPGFIYENEVISENEICQLKENVESLIEEIKKDHDIWNPFGQGLSKLFDDDAGYRTRQLKIINNNTRVHTLVNHKNRPKITIDSRQIPIVTWDDIDVASSLTKKPREIQPYKIKVFNEKIRQVILKHGNEHSTLSGVLKGLTASEIVEHVGEKEKGRQKYQETFLKPLSDQGFLDETLDPNNRTRHIYCLPEKYQKEDATIESTLIDISILDDSCVDSFVKQYIKHRFEIGELTIEDKKGNSINPQQLVELLKKRHFDSTNRHELDNVDSSIDIDRSS